MSRIDLIGYIVSAVVALACLRGIVQGLGLILDGLRSRPRRPRSSPAIRRARRSVLRGLLRG